MVEKSTKSGLSAYEKPHPSRIGLVFGHDPIPMTQIHRLNHTLILSRLMIVLALLFCNRLLLLTDT